jgi:hypothetical protein
VTKHQKKNCPTLLNFNVFILNFPKKGKKNNSIIEANIAITPQSLSGTALKIA